MLDANQECCANAQGWKEEITSHAVHATDWVVIVHMSLIMQQ
jgi:hypothetical protein